MNFGHIDNTQVGQLFESRKELRLSGIHAQEMAGIWSNKDEGASSIVLSGGYEDDIDNLNYILYTGHGGQDVPGGTQIKDQEFERGNRGLQLSYEYNLPVRVTRGHQIKNGPEKGYRYDGLYYVTRVERVIGKRGFYICRFHLESEISVESLEDKLRETLKPTYERVEHISSNITRLKRNVKIAEKVKEIYDYKCQVCNEYLATPTGGIAVGAHIKGLGRPYHGPDVLENMLCLCPNHHAQFDSFAFYINPENYEITGLDDYQGEVITTSKRHKIEKSFLEYHFHQYQAHN